MSAFNNLHRALAVALALVLLCPLALDGRTKNKLLALAQAAEDHKDYDQALTLYNQGLAKDPSNPAFQLGAVRAKFEAGQAHAERGMRLRQQGQLDQALAEFQKAFSIDPASTIALQEMRVTMKMIEDAKNKPESERTLTPADEARAEMVRKLRSIEGVPELKPIQRQIATLKMNNQPPRVLYETVGKLAGVNVIFDPQFQPNVKNANLDISNTNLEDALDYVALLTHTFWKPITSNAIFVTDDNPTKRRDYENVAVKTFYLQNPTTPTEFQEIVTAVRTVSDCRRMYTTNALNAIVARCTVDQLALVEKLIHDLDKPKPEVVVDMMVLSVNTTKTRDLAMGLSNGSGVSGLNLPVTFTPRNPVVINGGGSGSNSNLYYYSNGTYAPCASNPSACGSTSTTGTGTTTGTSGAIALGGLAHLGINDFSINLPGALLQAELSQSDTRVLQSPEVRVSDGMKATLNIGSRIPYASGSYQPGIGGVGVNPLVQTNFQYADVGVNLILQPHVHGDGEVTMHIEVDISSVASYTNFGGLSQPVIAQQKNTADLRVKDGEVSILGGLVQNQDTNSNTGIPGVSNIPVLGKFFLSGSHKEKDRQQLLIALVPHVVRTNSLSDLDLRGIAAGTDTDVKVKYAPPAETAPPVGTQPAATQPAETPSPATPQPAAAPAGPPRASFMPGTVTVHVGNPVVPTLQVDNVTDLASAIVHIKWDPKVLRLNAITPGAFLSMDGQQVNAPMDIRNDAGEATVNLTRLPGAGGVNGSGSLSSFSFTAIAPGTTRISVTDFGPMNSKQEAIQMTPPSVAVTVQ